MGHLNRILLIVVLKLPKFNFSAARHCKICFLYINFQEEIFPEEMCTLKSQKKLSFQLLTGVQKTTKK